MFILLPFNSVLVETFSTFFQFMKIEQKIGAFKLDFYEMAKKIVSMNFLLLIDKFFIEA